jgi:hypothetical protein
MRSLVIIAALGASALALPALAQTSSQSATPDNPASAASPPMSTSTSSATQTTSSSASSTSSDKQVCKSVTTRGTLIPKRECHTQAEWDEMRANAQQNLSNSHSNPGGPH